MPNPKIGRPVLNKNKVPARQWKLWSNHAKSTFNRVYYAMRPSNQKFFMHPKAALMRTSHWRTLRWNAAWEAACAADGSSHVTRIYTRGRR